MPSNYSYTCVQIPYPIRPGIFASIESERATKAGCRQCGQRQNEALTVSLKNRSLLGVGPVAPLYVTHSMLGIR